jgi:hypothetical protein
MSVKLQTTELPLAAKLYRESTVSMTGFDVVKIRGRHVVQFNFELPDGAEHLIDDFRTGRDGINPYEACRKMLLRIIDTEVRKAIDADRAALTAGKGPGCPVTAQGTAPSQDTGKW